MKVMGFYKETEGPEELTLEIIRGAGGELYVEIPTGLRNRMEIVVGNLIKCIVAGIVDEKGHYTRTIMGDVVWEIVGYWNELHLAEADIQQYGLKQGDRIKLVLKSAVQHGQEFPI
ncbi:MAG TPA: hypothetical protein DCQ14_02245 [Firmicutes bacterium]|nr:hypothetical protein [Bacillota bacterium]